jgi:hypothetical protein
MSLPLTVTISAIFHDCRIIPFDFGADRGFDAFSFASLLSIS